jgi:hypothetical protein
MQTYVTPREPRKRSLSDLLAGLVTVCDKESCTHCCYGSAEKGSFLDTLDALYNGDSVAMAHVARALAAVERARKSAHAAGSTHALGMLDSAARALTLQHDKLYELSVIKSRSAVGHNVPFAPCEVAKLLSNKRAARPDTDECDMCV